jgi:hypothetical protein
MNTRVQLRNFAKAELYACELYANRKQYASKDEILKLVRKKFRNNKYTIQATDAAAESWNYHRETGPWYDELTKKIGYFKRDDLYKARKTVKKSLEIII